MSSPSYESRPALPPKARDELLAVAGPRAILDRPEDLITPAGYQAD